MKRWMVVITVMLLGGLGATHVHAMHKATGSCDNNGTTGVKVLATSEQQTTTVDLVGSGGGFEPTPLFTTSGKTSSHGCIIATLSALAMPRDNWVVFQVLVDGKPMYGHISCDDFFTHMGVPHVAAYVQPATALIGDPEETDKNLFRMLSYTFYMPVAQGTHTITVKWAGCCFASGSINPNVFEIGRSTLLIHYK